MKLKLKVKLLDIGTGGPLVILLDADTAKKLNIFVGDRVRIATARGEKVCTLDLAEDEPHDTIGIFRETAKVLNLRKGQTVTVSPTKKPDSIKYIRDKLDGEKLNYEQMKVIVRDIAGGVLTTTEVAYFVAAAKTVGFDLDETYNLTKAMIDTGDKLSWSRTAVSKHCIGGVSGNRTTMLLVPIVAAAGLIMPKTSSRAITSPAGTADTMEVLAPVVVKSVGDLRKIVQKTNGCIMWGGSLNLAPADDKIIRAKHPLGLDIVPLLLSSILAKKKSEGADKVLIDIPVGKFSKIKTKSEFNDLKRKFIWIGKKLGMGIHVITSSAEEPVGNGVGPALEARDVLWALQNDPNAPKDLVEKSIRLAGILLKLGGKTKTEVGGKKLASKILKSGQAYDQMKMIIRAQGGSPKVNPYHLPLGKKIYIFRSRRAGRVREINDDVVAEVAKLAGAPREKSAGVYLHKSVGDISLADEPIFTIYSNSDYRLKQAKKLAGKMVKLK